MQSLFIFFRFLLTALPVLYLGYNITRVVLPQMPLLRSLNFRQAPVEVWFQGFQAAVLCGLWLLFVWILTVLLHLNWRVLCRQHLPLGFWRHLALACAFLLGLPALWECVWLCHDFFTQQRIVVEKQHLITAICVPYVSLLTLVRWVSNYRLHNNANKTTTIPKNKNK